MLVPYSNRSDPTPELAPPNHPSQFDEQDICLHLMRISAELQLWLFPVKANPGLSLYGGTLTTSQKEGSPPSLADAYLRSFYSVNVGYKKGRICKCILYPRTHSLLHSESDGEQGNQGN